MLFRRSFSAVSVILATLFAGAAFAQTTLKLVYTQAGGGPQTCIYTTDGNNVSLETETGALKTTGGTFGTNCPTAVPPGAPSFVDPLSTDLPSSSTTGSTVTLSWRADADSCTYDGSTFPAGVTYASWPTTGTACSSDAACDSPHSVNLQLTANGSYKFKLTCSRSGNQTTVSSEANTVASTQSTGCVAPAGLTRQTTAMVCGNGSYAFECRNVDITKFEQVFGYNRSAPTTPLKAWPGLRNLAQRIQINRNQYIALQFTVPSDFGTGKYGHYQLSEDNIGGQQGLMSVTLSPNCGDFSTQNPISTRCLINLGGEQVSMTWGSYAPTDPNYSQLCHLTPGQTYYLNVVYGSLSAPAPTTCVNTSYCDRPILNASGTGW